MRASLRAVLFGRQDPVTAFLAQIYAGGKRGYSFAPWMPGTLFQERTGAAATTPCAVGDPVGTIKDISGNGWYATATTDAKRGILRQDAGGRPYIELDGTDDSYRIASLILTTSQYEWIAFNQTNVAKFLFMEHGANAFGSAGHFLNGTNNAAWMMNRTGSGLAQYDNGNAGWANGKNINERQYIAGVGGSLVKNGTVVTPGTVLGSAQSESTFTAQMNLFSRDQTSLFSEGHYYGGFLVDGAAPSAALIVQGRSILAARAGVTL